MELMSSLLLCAVVAFPPLALAESTMKYPIRMNNSMSIRPNPIHPISVLGTRSLLIKRKSLSPFMDFTCKNCLDCMERTVKEFQFKSQSMNSRAVTDDLYGTNYNEVVRDKREFDFNQDIKRGKTKKTKYIKNVTVTKYNLDKQIVALKVREYLIAAGNPDDTPASTSCLVYSVKKSSPCDTPESDLILAAARRKVNKKSKKEKDKTKGTTRPSTPRVVIPVFRKREIDNSQLPENVMSSIEELY